MSHRVSAPNLTKNNPDNRGFWFVYFYFYGRHTGDGSLAAARVG